MLWHRFRLVSEANSARIQRISIWETNCVIHWIEIYQSDSVIHLLNDWGLVAWYGSLRTKLDSTQEKTRRVRETREGWKRHFRPSQKATFSWASQFLSGRRSSFPLMCPLSLILSSAAWGNAVLACTTGVIRGDQAGFGTCWSTGRLAFRALDGQFC